MTGYFAICQFWVCGLDVTEKVRVGGSPSRVYNPRREMAYTRGSLRIVLEPRAIDTIAETAVPLPVSSCTRRTSHFRRRFNS
ncbi:hypothetical protein SBA4_1270007 [Candidatus Sulfopaludibacter sp. SbA4]|nr:hypothetical protein SBA4_1270007 [Candidatus Sulfopaludibacter sp. SbA4]